jgi:ribosomal protein S18 acetylase RimI-like enzyme
MFCHSKDREIEYIYRIAIPDDIQVILTWVETPELLKLWGGPSLTFPPVPEQIWQEIEADDDNSYSMIDINGNLAGFGQILFRYPGAVHLGRIIIAPDLRGKCLGRILCSYLLQKAFEQYNRTKATLNVYKNNTPAVKLYKSLGFEVLYEDQNNTSFRMHKSLMSEKEKFHE